MQLKCDGAMTPADVGRDTATVGAGVEEALRPLVSRGYVARDGGPDGASRLTGEGERALSALWPIVERTEERVLAGFSDDERARLRDFLARIRANYGQSAPPRDA